MVTLSIHLPYKKVTLFLAATATHEPQKNTFIVLLLALASQLIENPALLHRQKLSEKDGDVAIVLFLTLSSVLPSLKQ